MIKVICVGKMKDKQLESVQNDYLKKSNPYHRLELIEVAEAKSKSMEKNKINEEEGTNLLKQISPSDFVIALTLNEEQLTSEQFSKYLYSHLNLGRTVVFVIGGSWGLASSVLERADYKLSLSKWTLPHLLCRVVLLEQIYRAHGIELGSLYHK